MLYTMLKQPVNKAAFDPEMLYVECRNCGQPLIWEAGKTSELLSSAGIESNSLDLSCLILSEFCQNCRPDIHEFILSVVRLPQPSSFDTSSIRELLDSVEAEIAADIGGNFFKMKLPHGNA